MKLAKKIFPTFVLFFWIFFSWSAFSIEDPKNIKFSIFHTNDLHSHFDGVKYQTAKKGGFARLATAIEKVRREKKAQGQIVFGVDAGDFFAGTIFSAIAPSSEKSFPEYEFLSKNFFDIVTLGNHEFDPTNKGLEKMLAKAQDFKKTFPEAASFIASNLYLKNKNSPLKTFIGENSFIRPYVIRDYISPNGKQSLRVAFLGILGPDGCRVSTSTREDVGFVGFYDNKSKADMGALSDHINLIVRDLREKQKVQVVILAMHGGGKEATKLSKKTKGIDIFIAGHTHEVQFEQVNDVIISQTGSYGENLGVLELVYNTESKKVSLVDPAKNPLIAIDETIPTSLMWMKQIDQWRSDSLKLMGDEKFDPNEIIFSPDQDYLHVNEPLNPFGTFIATNLLEELNREASGDVDFYFTLTGLLRNSWFKGVPYNRADIFELVAIGFDQNLVPGVDVVTFYLTPKEVKLFINFLEIYSKVSSSYSPVFSRNLTFNIAKYGIPFLNRIQDLKLNGVKIDNYERLIKVATNRYIINSLETIETATRGFIKIDPKDKLGKSTRTYQSFSKEYKLLTNYFVHKRNKK